MRDADDGDCVGLDDIENDVLPLAEAPLAFPHLVSHPPGLWVLGQPVQSVPQAMQIRFHLRRTPLMQRPLGNRIQITGRPWGDADPGHAAVDFARAMTASMSKSVTNCPRSA